MKTKQTACEFCNHNMLITERFCLNCGAENPNFQFDYEKTEDEHLSAKKQQNAKNYFIIELKGWSNIIVNDIAVCNVEYTPTLLTLDYSI